MKSLALVLGRKLLSYYLVITSNIFCEAKYFMAKYFLELSVYDNYEVDQCGLVIAAK